jgi:hypothetical protein
MLDEFLKEEGILEETRTAAFKEACMAGAESNEESED